MNPLTQSKNTTILPLLIALTLGCFGLSPQARAVCQEGCLGQQNTVLVNCDRGSVIQKEDFMISSGLAL